jgi:hypothetical protein
MKYLVEITYLSEHYHTKVLDQIIVTMAQKDYNKADYKIRQWIASQSDYKNLFDVRVNSFDYLEKINL